MGDVIHFPRNTASSAVVRGGNCPVCGKSDGNLNIRSDHFGVCKEHQVYWYIGTNLFSCWKEENWQLWQKNFDLLKGRKQVGSGPPPDYRWGERVVDEQEDDNPFGGAA